MFSVHIMKTGRVRRDRGFRAISFSCGVSVSFRASFCFDVCASHYNTYRVMQTANNTKECLADGQQTPAAKSKNGKP